MSHKQVEKDLKAFCCPKCKGDLEINWSACYDPSCCGVEDIIQCETCPYSTDGYFQSYYYDDLKDMFELKHLSVEDCINVLSDKVEDLQRQINELNRKLG